MREDLRNVLVWVAGALLIAVVSSGSVVAQGQSKTANLKVSAAVVANCLVTTTDVVFGNYDPVGANGTTPLDAEGSVTLTCTRGVHARVRLAYGQYASGNLRRMASGSDRLSYELYLDAQRTTPWNSPFGFFPGTGAAVSVAPYTRPVYGRVAAGQDVPVGSYSDEVLVLVTF
jgi:spore coat protein U-like protein